MKYQVVRIARGKEQVVAGPDALSKMRRRLTQLRSSTLGGRVSGRGGKKYSVVYHLREHVMQQSSGKQVYYVEFQCGCTLVRAPDQDSAEIYARREFGRYNEPYSSRLATDDDIANVGVFAGRTHETEAIEEP